MTNSTISITAEQSQHLTDLLNQQDYPSAYRYLRDIVKSDPKNDPRLASWLDKAADINANNGTFYSDFVRGATINAAQNQGVTVTEEDFQVASDKLATDIVQKIVSRSEIPSIDDIVSNDVATIVQDLNLLPQSWAGTAMAWVPYAGLNLDANSPFYRDLFSAYRGSSNAFVFFNGSVLFQQLLGNNFAGLKYATESQLSQLLEATMDHANGIINSDNSIFDLIKNSLNSEISSSTTISQSQQSSFNSLFTSESTTSIPAPRRVDPLTLDLDGDGVELIAVNNSTAFFDLDVTPELDANGNPTGNYLSDGVKEQVGWVSGDDGLLTLDKNNNGTIDNILELFGKTDKTGTEELREYDLNNDGVINSNDTVFSNLKIWQDHNQNGISESSELKTLTELGITSISVSPESLTPKNETKEGSLVISEGTYTQQITNQDGSTTLVNKTYANLDLAVNQSNSASYTYTDSEGNVIGDYDLNLDVLSLSMSRGYVSV
jgi:hypothetical protein